MILKKDKSIKWRSDSEQLHVFIFITSILLTVKPWIPLSGSSYLFNITVLFVMNISQSINFFLKILVFVNKLFQIMLIFFFDFKLNPFLVVLVIIALITERTRVISWLWDVRYFFRLNFKGGKWDLLNYWTWLIFLSFGSLNLLLQV